MFLAGWLAARMSQAESRPAGMLHGAALWGFMLVAGLWIATMAVTRTAGAAASAAGGAAQAPSISDIDDSAYSAEIGLAVKLGYMSLDGSRFKPENKIRAKDFLAGVQRGMARAGITSGVECKLVRDITEEEAKAAGFPRQSMCCYTNRYTFEFGWDSLYAKKGYPFESAYGWKLKFESEVKR
jgi:hypothetical protein